MSCEQPIRKGLIENFSFEKKTLLKKLLEIPKESMTVLAMILGITKR